MTWDSACKQQIAMALVFCPPNLYNESTNESGM
jgi:hypothetical protein